MYGELQSTVFLPRMNETDASTEVDNEHELSADMKHINENGFIRMDVTSTLLPPAAAASGCYSLTSQGRRRTSCLHTAKDPT